MTDPTDLGLADIAPVTLEDDVFEGMLDYAVSEEAHDLDDSLVPADEAPDDAGDVDDIDDVALSDDVADPFAESGGDDDDPDNLGIDEIGVPDDVADDGTDDLDAGLGDDFDGDAAGFGVDGFDDVPVDDGVLDASPDEDPGLGVDMDW